MKTGLSIIFPSFNSGSLLNRCLKAAECELKALNHPFEIIVADSSRQKPELPQIHNLKLAHSKAQLFPSEARNLGARVAKYPILIFLDADVEILPGALQKLIDGLQKKFDVVGGVYEIHNPNTSRISTFQDLVLLFRFKNIPPERIFFSSSHFAVSKESFWEVGGFSENLQSYEDLDLGFKFQKRFFKAHVCLKSRGYHLKNFSLKSIFNDYYVKTRNMVYYRLKKINGLHWADTFFTKSMRASYYLVFCYIFLFAMLATSGGTATLSFWLSMLGLLLILDIGLLIHFLAFVWGVTRRPLWVVGGLIFFKATTIPIIFGAIHGFYRFFIKDDSLVNKINPHIAHMSITHYTEGEDR